MKKNVVIWRFHQDILYPAIVNLKDKGIINIIAWIGDKYRCPYCTHDILSWLRGILPEEGYYSFDLDIYKQVYNSSLYKFIDMYSMRKLIYLSNYKAYDFVHMFNLYFGFFYKLLTQNKVDLVLFGYIPHEGPDLILYELAKKLGIKTILFYQTLFPNKFFYCYDIEDFGKFDNIPAGNIWTPFTIPKQYEKKIFYMEKKPIRFIPKNDFLKWFRSLQKISLKTKSFKIEHILQKIIEVKSKLVYKTNIKYYGKKEVDLGRNFVYFPLHLQPELTTAALGGIFVDQLLAIEKLRDLLPEDWFIYVKENPKQTQLMRSNWFFKRLTRIPNVCLIHPKFNTYSLLKKCIFVATITGTVGWEAISGGKNVLIFGNAWYKKLPGVFMYNENFKLDDILNFKINHDELEAKLGYMLSKAVDGVVDPAYIAIIENFDSRANITNIENILEKLIKEVFTG